MPKRNKARALPIREWERSNASARRDHSDNRDRYSSAGSTPISQENLRNAYWLGDLKPATRRDEFQTIPGCGEFSPTRHCLLWELLEWHAGVEPISPARS